MSDETPAPPPAPAGVTLPPTTHKTLSLTWKRPFIVTGNDDTSITVHKEVLSQQDYSVEEGFSFEEVRETPFKIVSLSPMQFGPARLQVLDDHSMPKGVDYLAMVGQKVLVGFRCVRHESLSQQAGRNVFFVYRSTIVLP